MSLNLYYVFKKSQEKYRYELYNLVAASASGVEGSLQAATFRGSSQSGIDVIVTGSSTSCQCDDSNAAARDARGRRVAEELYVKDCNELFVQFQKYNVEVLRQYFDAEYAEFKYRKCQNNELTVKIVAAIKNEFIVILDIKLQEFLRQLEILLKESLCLKIKIDLEEVLTRFVIQIERAITVIVQTFVAEIKVELDVIKVKIDELKILIEGLCQKKLQLSGKLFFEASAECEAEVCASAKAVSGSGAGVSLGYY